MIVTMGRFQGDAGVQLQGCMALWNTAANDGHEAVVAAAGGIAAVVRAMGRFEGDARVQKAGCGMLASLADENDENQAAVVAAGGVAAVIGAMGRFEGHLGVQKEGCEVLGHLGGKWENDGDEDNDIKVAIAGASPR